MFDHLVKNTCPFHHPKNDDCEDHCILYHDIEISIFRVRLKSNILLRWARVEPNDLKNYPVENSRYLSSVEVSTMECIELPVFDIFQFALEELDEKMKLFLTFA